MVPCAHAFESGQVRPIHSCCTYGMGRKAREYQCHLGVWMLGYRQPPLGVGISGTGAEACGWHYGSVTHLVSAEIHPAKRCFIRLAPTFSPGWHPPAICKSAILTNSGAQSAAITARSTLTLQYMEAAIGPPVGLRNPIRC